MRALRTLTLLAAVAFLLVGCGERAEPLGELDVRYPVEVAGAGESPLVLQAPPERVVALAGGPAELLVALGHGDRLVGAPAGFGAPGTGDADAVVGVSGQIDVEAVTGLAPDLLVATPDTDRVDLARAERESGAAVYVQPALSIEDVRRAAVELGLVVGAPVAGRELAARIGREAEAVEGEVAGRAPVQVFVDTGLFIPPPERSLLADLVRRAGGRIVPETGPGRSPVDVGDVVAADPDVYLTTSDSGVTLARLLGNARLRAVTAVREERVAVLPADLVTTPGPRVAEALAAVVEALHDGA